MSVNRRGVWLTLYTHGNCGRQRVKLLFFKYHFSSESEYLVVSVVEMWVKSDVEIRMLCFLSQLLLQRGRRWVARSLAPLLMTVRLTDRLPSTSGSLRVWRTLRNCCSRRVDEWTCHRRTCWPLHDRVTPPLSLIVRTVTWSTQEQVKPIHWTITATVQTEACHWL